MNFLLYVTFEPDSISSSSHFFKTLPEAKALQFEYRKKLSDCCQTKVFKLNEVPQ